MRNKISKTIKVHGGNTYFADDISPQDCPIFDYIVTAPTQAQQLSHDFSTTLEIVKNECSPVLATTLWLQECIKYKKILDVNSAFVFKPLLLSIKDYRSIFGIMLVSISGFGPQEGYDIGQLVQLLGGKVVKFSSDG